MLRWIKENITSTVSVRTEVEVDVDLSEFDTDELVAELEERGFDTKGNKIALPDDLFEQRMAMMRALWEKNDAKVIELLKTYLCGLPWQSCYLIGEMGMDYKHTPAGAERSMVDALESIASGNIDPDQMVEIAKAALSKQRLADDLARIDHEWDGKL